MKHSRNSKAYREAWLVIAIVILLVYVHDYDYQQTVIESYYFGGE